MRSFTNWLLVIFMVMFWIFRVVVTYMAATGQEFGFTPINQQVEIVLLFVTIVCIVLVIKRKIFGGALYLLAYGGYFGVDLFNHLKPIIDGEPIAYTDVMPMIISVLAMILAISVVMDLISDRLKRPEDKQTEWFYANKELDRKLDDRADKNNYKLL